jgi:hypothetical protein
MSAKSKNSHDPLQSLPLPATIKNLIEGGVISLAGASAFYKKKAEVATLLEDDVEPLPDCRYRLKNRFDSYFFGSLPMFLRSDPRRPADSLADALFFLGRQWAKIGRANLPTASIPSDEFLHKAWTAALDWEAFLLRDACIGEEWWQNLGADGKVRPWSGGSDPSAFNLRIDFGWDTTLPP